MARKVKCLFCGEQFDRDSVEFVQVKNRYAHKECFDKAEASKSQEEKDLKELEEYIMKMFNETFVNARIRQQIKRMREQYNYSYSGILKSLISLRLEEILLKKPMEVLVLCLMYMRTQENTIMIYIWLKKEMRIKKWEN